MKTITTIFLNTDQSRLRVGWRLLIQLVPFLVLVVSNEMLVRRLRPGSPAMYIPNYK